MQQKEESTKIILERLLIEMGKLQVYYHSLIFSGTFIAVFLFVGSFAFIDSWWCRTAAVCLSLSLLLGSAWIYLKAYRELNNEMCFYKDVLGIPTGKKKAPVIQGFTYIWRLSGNLYFLCFITGLLLSLAIVGHLQNNYENNSFSTLSRKVVGQNRPMPEDSIFIRSMALSHQLLACGSYSVVLCRILQNLHYNTRLLQMKVRDNQACHTVLEVQSSTGWVVLDPLYNLYFKRPDGRLASFDDVSHSWDSFYHAQAPANYNTRYDYAGARYTNWNSFPVVMPLLKRILGIFMEKERLAHFSLRVYFVKKYMILKYISLMLLIFAFSRLTGRIFEIWKRSRNRKANAIKSKLRKIPAFEVSWPGSSVN